MYHIKMNSTGAPRWISKLLQNSLYGIFGRKREMIETKIIFRSDLCKYVSTNIIKSIIEISEDKCATLMVKNGDLELIQDLNTSLNIQIKDCEKLVKANVAIASAITSYARIHMLPFKVDPCTVYTDTDSILTTK